MFKNDESEHLALSNSENSQAKMVNFFYFSIFGKFEFLD